MPAKPGRRPPRLAAEDPHERTKLRLLEAAGELFAEHGFDQTSIRDICTRAGTNVASVNYHFGGKLQLYQSAIAYWIKVASEKFPPQMGVVASDPPAKQLKAFVRGYLLRLFSGGKPAWHAKLVAREMAQPTGAWEAVVRSILKPQMEFMETVVGRVLGPGASRELIERGVLAVASQCVFLHCCKPAIEAAYPDLAPGEHNIDDMTDAIATVSYHGLRALAKAHLKSKSRRR
jgi:AcrR family transcriptional regulator